MENYQVSSTSRIPGNRFVDDRGSLTFVNDFNPSLYKRFYVVENHSTGFIRAWHGHLLEGKAMIALAGSFVIGVVKMSTADNPDKNSIPERYVVSADNPSVLIIPPGYANGTMSLTASAKLLIFSDSTVEESKSDDYRYPHDFWDIWKVDYR